MVISIEDMRAVQAIDSSSAILCDFCTEDATLMANDNGYNMLVCEGHEYTLTL